MHDVGRSASKRCTMLIDRIADAKRQLRDRTCGQCGVE